MLGETVDKTKVPRFTTKKWTETFDQSNRSYNPNKDIRFKTPQLRSDLCDFNDAYIVTGKITATNLNPPAGVNYSRNLPLKNSAPFFNCILKINSQLIEDAQDLDIVMTTYNLLYYSKNYRKTIGSFWNYYPDKSNSAYFGNNARARIFYPVNESESFDYKTKLVGKI